MAPLKSIINYSSDSHFPLENIPFGVYRLKSTSGTAAAAGKVATRIGDTLIPLEPLAHLFRGPHFPSSTAKSVFAQATLNAFMALGRPAWRECRNRIQQLFSQSSTANDCIPADLLTKISVPIGLVEMVLPVAIGDYTDFYASREHATNVGIMFRGKENALMPNWLHLPVGYHGRASSIVVSGTPIRRPCGQRNAAAKTEPPRPVYGPSVRMDFELEMAFFIGGPGNKLGDPIPIAQANDHVFGVALMNDWSARDIQAWEYVPLGPFLGKNFGTTISPWIVTLDALEPWRVDGPAQIDPKPLPYLQEPSGTKTAFNVELMVELKPQASQKPTVISKTNLKYMYWSIGQQIAHHTVNGCNLRTGDLLATGTISGPSESSYGSMLELSWSGTKQIQLTDGSGQVRTFLEDGDELRLTGWCEGDGYRVGFGECTGVITPAIIPAHLK